MTEIRKIWNHPYTVKFYKDYFPSLSVFIIGYVLYGLFFLAGSPGIAIFIMGLGGFGFVLNILTHIIEYRKDKKEEI